MRWIIAVIVAIFVTALLIGLYLAGLVFWVIVKILGTIAILSVIIYYSIKRES